MNNLILQPVLIGPARGYFGLDFLITDNPSLGKIDEEHLSRLETRFFHDTRRINGKHAHLARHDDGVVIGNVDTARPEAVPVKHGTDVGAVGKGN